MLGVALLMMLAVFGQIPLNDAIVGRYVADEYRARVLGVRYVVSLGVAAVAVPMIAALHRTEGGFSNVFLVLAVLAGGVMPPPSSFPRAPSWRRTGRSVLAGSRRRLPEVFPGAPRALFARAARHLQQFPVAFPACRRGIGGRGFARTPPLRRSGPR